MRSIGMNIDFIHAPMRRHFIMNANKLVNVRYLESLLHYKFHDPSLLVKTLTHGSSILPEIARCYQHLECLGDVVLDYVVTTQLYFKYSRLILRLITYLRSTFVNTECSAQSEVKASMFEHIVHASHQICKGRYVVQSRNLRNWTSCLHFDGRVKLLSQISLEVLLSTLLE